ncbi:MAG: hypothetical protein H6609_19945 [Ignavibacteriales bacterium]|nr:hypothetical protein [Ignavibacteriales bacterium]
MKKLLFNLFFLLTVLHAQEVSSSIHKFGQLKIILHVELNSYYLIVDKKFDDYIEIDKDSILTLPIGDHEITIVSKNYRDYEFKVKIEEGKLVTHRSTIISNIIDESENNESSYSWIKFNVNVKIFTDYDSDLFINGEFIGKGSTTQDLPEGDYKIESKHILAGNTTRLLKIRSKKFQTISMYNKPEKLWSQFLSVFPGVSQFYKGQLFRSYLYLGLTISSIAMAVKYNVSFRDNNFMYEEYKKYYDKSDSKSIIIEGNLSYPILENANKTQEYYDLAKRDAQIRDVFLYAAVGIYIINILDAMLIEPDGGYRQMNEENLLKGFSLNIFRDNIGINYTIKF